MGVGTLLKENQVPHLLKPLLKYHARIGQIMVYFSGEPVSVHPRPHPRVTAHGEGSWDGPWGHFSTAPHRVCFELRFIYVAYNMPSWWGITWRHAQPSMTQPCWTPFPSESRNYSLKWCWVILSRCKAAQAFWRSDPPHHPQWLVVSPSTEKRSH